MSPSMTTAATTNAPTGGDTGDITGTGATAQPAPPQPSLNRPDPSTSEDIAAGNITKIGTSGQASLRVSRSSTGARIALVDNTVAVPRRRSRSPSEPPSRTSSDSQRSSEGGYRGLKSRIKNREEGEGHREVLRKAIAERRYKKWSLGPEGSEPEDYYDTEEDENGEGKAKEPPDDRADGVVVERAPAEEVVVDGSNKNLNGSNKNSTRSKTGTIKSKLKSAVGRSTTTGESSQTNGQRVRRKGPHGEDTIEIAEIDVLYENQRGWFVCGIPLFSSRSLLNFDPAPWQNHLFHDSAVSIVDAQVPDPSWTWAWKSWYVDMTTDVDEEGWAYSFSFSPAFAWHGNHVWFHSFVRRRRWLRKRVKLPEEIQRKRGIAEGSVYDGDTMTTERTGHRLNTDYFTIHSKKSWRANGDRNGSERSRGRGRRSSTGSHLGSDDDLDREIYDIATLLKVVKTARLDREKIDAVMNFIHNDNTDEMQYLPDQVSTLLSQLIFQASRRQLVAKISEALAAAPNNKLLKDILAAVDKEVKRLEFWSDLKNVTESGDSVTITNDGMGISGAGKGKGKGKERRRDEEMGVGRE